MNAGQALGRDSIVERLRQDLIGPGSNDEVLSDRPSDVYLTGIIWPRETRMAGEDMDRLGANKDGDESGEPGEEDEVTLVGAMRPCVAGVSFAASAVDAPQVEISINVGIYKPREEGEGTQWQRCSISIPVAAKATQGVQRIPLSADGLPEGISLHLRTIRWSGTDNYLITATLVNAAKPEAQNRKEIEKVTLFQSEITVRPGAGAQLIPRPSRKPTIDDEDRSSALLYRFSHEFAVGHTCGATWISNNGGTADQVSTDWIPSAEVPAVSADGDSCFLPLRDSLSSPLSADCLAKADNKTLEIALLKIPEAYEKWLMLQEQQVSSLPPEHQPTAQRHISECQLVATRMKQGATKIASDPILSRAFRLANRAMNVQAEWAQLRQNPSCKEVRPLTWRPFQLGFLLLTALSAVDRLDDHRQTMDLLWFPTGGGKTEAYLALIAFVSFARRLKTPSSGGVAAIMRYTLRLLTTQQLSRAAAMVLACEAIRRGRIDVGEDARNLGGEAFGIGLWVGGDATPNSIEVAASVLAGSEGPSPCQISNCPACGTLLDWRAKRLRGRPVAIEVYCENAKCALYDPKQSLPIYTVDEDIYERQPTLLIGTVDKFAQIVRRKEIGRLFDCGGASPPDLIIQDELHLISGPLGSLVGLYEAAIDRLLSVNQSPPKVIGSTATIRKAADQVKALFCREVCQFPPAVINAMQSGFAAPAEAGTPGRLYVGVTTAGRSAKFTLQAVSGSLLQSGYAGFDSDEARNPYWTLVGYFNALRELGGAVVLMQDDVPDSIELYAKLRDEKPRNAQAIEELTSRRSQDEVRDMLDWMDIPAGKAGALDAVLATNMLSVGVDIQRLGLMLVNGQPKGVSEYIQATSRVGRRYPGLVVVVLNNAKARDRSHYESFKTWHSTLYRDVEATSVTPFASRARDRALHAALVATARHLIPSLRDRPTLDAAAVSAVEKLIADIAARAASVDPEETAVTAELLRFLNYWRTRNPRVWWNDYDVATSMLVSAEASAALRAQGRDARGAVPTLNSLRTVEPGVPFRLASHLANRRNPNSGGGGQVL